MSDPVRLLDETSSPALAAVLRSAAADAPAHKKRELARISAAAALVIGGGGAAGVGASSSLWLRRTTWLVVSSALVVTGGGIWSAHVRERAASSSVAARAPEPEQRGEVAAVAAPSSSAAPVMSMRVDELPAARNEAPVTSRADAVPSSMPDLGRRGRAAEAPLPDELSMIEAVRSALGAQHPAEALERVETYRRSFPHAAFDVEADVLEVQALAALGRTDAAREKAERFLRSHPASPYEKRIRAAASLDRRDNDEAP